jgi:hypothetical protein
MQRTKDSINNCINIIYLVNNAFTEKRINLPLFLYKELVTKRLCGDYCFLFLDKFFCFGKYLEIYVLLLYISLLFGKKEFQIFNISNLSKKAGKKNPLWWRPRGQTLGKGSTILFCGFNSQVKDQNPKTMRHVTCNLCTRLFLE